ncbi:MAG: hypothetical protein AVO35_12125 [Candidatus Aegiribacteria sp. MLS_C]|nr:MAG: hypothetical protein AVO35_12125 [Candidatus Aegiribacteria sp. MLS_C]
MRRLVFVAYTFPPVSTGSAPMNLRLADILVRNGWMPSVVTAERTGSMPRDPSLLELLPKEVRVIRTGGTAARGSGQAAGRGGTVTGAGGRRGLRKFVLETLLQPDRYVTWLPGAVPATLAEIDRVGADLIVTLGPPHSVHLTGMICSFLSGRPWVAYFGDLWALDGYVDWKNTSWVRRRLTPLMERAVVSGADGIITTTEGSSDYFRKTYDHECPPVQTLWNGVPLEEREMRWNRSGTRVPEDDIVITYTGFFMGLQTPEYFLRGFRLFVNRHPESRLRFRVVGDFGAFSDLPGELGLTDRVDILGTVPFAEVRELQLDSDVLLLILPPQPGNELKNPSKTVEYLLARRPVLAVAPEGDLTGLIEKLGAGYTASHDPESVCSAIEEIHRDLAAGRHRILGDPSDLDGEMDMDAGGRRIAAFLDRISE